MNRGWIMLNNALCKYIFKYFFQILNFEDFRVHTRPAYQRSYLTSFTYSVLQRNTVHRQRESRLQRIPIMFWCFEAPRTRRLDARPGRIFSARDTSPELGPLLRWEKKRGLQLKSSFRSVNTFITAWHVTKRCFSCRIWWFNWICACVVCGLESSPITH